MKVGVLFVFELRDGASANCAAAAKYHDAVDFSLLCSLKSLKVKEAWDVAAREEK